MRSTESSIAYHSAMATTAQTLATGKLKRGLLLTGTAASAESEGRYFCALLQSFSEQVNVNVNGFHSKLTQVDPSLEQTKPTKSQTTDHEIEKEHTLQSNVTPMIKLGYHLTEKAADTVFSSPGAGYTSWKLEHVLEGFARRFSVEDACVH